MNLTTLTSRAAAALVAAVAGVISYQHIVAVAESAGEHRSAAVLVPLAIDGLIVVGTMAMIEDKRRGRVPRLSARFALGFGILATVSANIASAQPSWTARAVAVVPALSFLISVEVLARTGRQLSGVNAAAQHIEAERGKTTPDLEKSKSDTGRSARRRVGGKRTAAEKVAAARERLGPDATQADVAKRAKVGVRTAARYWRDAQADLAPNGARSPETAPIGAVPEPDGRRVEGVPEMAEVQS